MSRKGHYRPKRPEKYIGDVSKIVYRSSWEKKLMAYLDSNPNIRRWSSEPFPLPYINPLDNRYHKYYVDFYVEVMTHSGELKQMLIEVKPFKQTKPPLKYKPNATSKRKRRYFGELATYEKNKAKWEVAKSFCEDRKWDFKIFTEKELMIEDRKR